MRRKSSKINVDYKKDIPKYSDDRIIHILKMRDYYQPEAAKLAIEEAIKRGIIFSEQDLFAEEFTVEELNFSLFPSIKKNENKNKIRRSIARSMVIFGVLPLVFGFVQSNAGNKIEGVFLLLFGLVWIYSAAQLIKNYQKLFVNILMLEACIAAIYIVAKLVVMSRFVYFEIFLLIVLFLLIVYGLLFLKRSSA